MDDEIVSVRVQWTWGEPIEVSLSKFQTVGELLESAGFSAPPETTLFAAYRGRILKPELSLKFYDIKTGARIVCGTKRRPSKRKSEQFLRLLNCPRGPVPAFARPNRDPVETDALDEFARLTDLSFASWEALPEYASIMKELLKEQEEQSDRRWDVHLTVVKSEKRIGEDPLPKAFHSDSSGVGACKGRGWDLLSEVPGDGFGRSFCDSVKKP